MVIWGPNSPCFIGRLFYYKISIKFNYENHFWGDVTSTENRVPSPCHLSGDPASLPLRGDVIYGRPLMHYTQCDEWRRWRFLANSVELTRAKERDSL